jgi:hypothetical protein
MAGVAAVLGVLLAGCAGGGKGAYILVNEASGSAFDCGDCTVRTDPGQVPAQLAASGKLSVNMKQVQEAVGPDEFFKFQVVDPAGLVVKESRPLTPKYLMAVTPPFRIELFDPTDDRVNIQDKENYDPGRSGVKP